MNECSLQFPKTAALCSFIQAAHLQNFLLLGKKSILIANFTEAAIDLAVQTFAARRIETAELSQIAAQYFGKEACRAAA